MQSSEKCCQQANATQQPSDVEAPTWCDVLAGLVTDEGPESGAAGNLKQSNVGSSESSSGSSEKQARAAVVSEVANALHFGKVEEEEIEKMTPALRSEVRISLCCCTFIETESCTHTCLWHKQQKKVVAPVYFSSIYQT